MTIAAVGAREQTGASGRRLDAHAGDVGLNPTWDDPAGCLQAAIDAARDLAWRPTSNLPASIGYIERREAAERLRSVMAEARLPDAPADDLRYLFAAMVRVCVASFANRRGEPYYERKRLVYELRGCLDVYDRGLRS